MKLHPRLRPRTFKQVMFRVMIHTIVWPCLFIAYVGFTNHLAIQALFK